MAKRNTAPTSPKRVRSYQEILKDPGPTAKSARKALDALTTKCGIDEAAIAMRFECFRVYEHFGTGRLWKERFTIDRPTARRLARRLRRDADDLREAIAPKFKFLMGYGSPISADFICNLISRAAVLLEGSLEETSDKGADWTLEPKRELTQFVWRTSGRRRPLDREVSDLIAAILGSEYTYEDQRKFRERNCHFEGADSMFSTTVEPDNTAVNNS
ncbi:MAG: hypothetical protein ABSH47_12385 [Bryobacteraceae bacterium]